MDYAREKYDKFLVEDVKILLKVLVLYLPLPVFWALFDQMVRISAVYKAVDDCRSKPDPILTAGQVYCR